MRTIQLGGNLDAALTRKVEDNRIEVTIEDIRSLASAKFTGSVTIHFQDGIAREIEQHTRKRLKKQD